MQERVSVINVDAPKFLFLAVPLASFKPCFPFQENVTIIADFLGVHYTSTCRQGWEYPGAQRISYFLLLLLSTL